MTTDNTDNEAYADALYAPAKGAPFLSGLNALLPEDFVLGADGVWTIDIEKDA